MMASARAYICGCTCRLLRTCPRQQLRSWRYFSAHTQKDINQGGDNINQSTRRRKKRDPHAVLKALSSTVQKVPGTPSIGFFEDSYLTPRSDYTKREYLAALESGRNAAEFVIRKYPELCRLREPVPSWPDEYATFEELEDVETLNYLIKTDKVDAAVALYETLKEKGEKIDLKSTNAFLDLVGYHGVGIIANQPEASETSTDESSSSSDSESSEEEDQTVEVSEELQAKSNFGFKTRFSFSENSYAARLFASMDEKTEDTYEAFTLALLKHGEFDKACEIYDQMRANEFRGSTFLLNRVLEELNLKRDDLKPNEKWKLAKDYLKPMKDGSSNVPDVGTFNALLRLSAGLGREAPAKAGMLLREMVAHDVEPSLGSYILVLEANDANKSDKYQVLEDVVKKVNDCDKRFIIQDPLDVTFFSVAMNLARSFGNAEIGKALYATAKKNGNWAMLSSSTSAFLGNYICTLARAEKSVDLLFEEYGRLVPNEVVPRDWVYAELFRRLEKGENPEMILKLCRDMKLNRVRLSFSVCERIFAAFSSPIPAELRSDCLNAALDMMKWMAMFDIPVTSLILGQVARLYALNGLLDDAWKTINLFEEKNLRPNFTMMSAILKQALDMGDQKFVLKTLKKMAEYNYTIPIGLKKQILGKLDLGERERNEMEKVFVDLM